MAKASKPKQIKHKPIGFQTFSWDGEPIPDVHAWAKNRGEKLVHYQRERKEGNPYTGSFSIITEVGFMPESFWDSRKETDGWVYRELSRELP